MSAYRYVGSNALPEFLASLAPHFERILVPKAKDGIKPSVVFEPWAVGDEVCLAKATVAPKECVFPKAETLFNYHVDKHAEGGPTLKLDPTIEAKTTFVFAARPCDAQGITILDRPFLEGRFQDPYYKAKRDKVCILSLTCPSGCENCFCHWVGIGPTSPNGSDILMTAIESGYVLQGITDKGKELLGKLNLPDAEDKVEEVNAIRKKAWETLKPAPKLDKISEALGKRFADTKFWEEQTAQCLSCGACTYFCPTCYCFTITDEGEAQSAKGGVRMRSQDNCMAQLYTREASGHNPRPTKAMRMRNRISHKYHTYKDTWGQFSCSGCGRCVQHCPVGLDIRAIVVAALQESSAASGGK